MSCLNGEIELMSPSRNHEGIKTLMGGLIEAYAVETGLDMSGYGSWTLKNESKGAGTEPDECYVVGDVSKQTPDLALEVVWTHGGLDKLEIYARLGVREVWIWDQASGIRIFVLREGRYEKVPASEIFPALDIALLASFVGSTNHSRAVRDYLAALRGAG
jgi:Uma2 family endonuclease